jgi:hypothetical protein
MRRARAVPTPPVAIDFPAADLTDADLTNAKWPEGRQAPDGWMRARFGLRRAGFALRSGLWPSPILAGQRFISGCVLALVVSLVTGFGLSVVDAEGVHGAMVGGISLALVISQMPAPPATPVRTPRVGPLCLTAAVRPGSLLGVPQPERSLNVCRPGWTLMQPREHTGLDVAVSDHGSARPVTALDRRPVRGAVQ